jgi:cysteine-rich repeat protein
MARGRTLVPANCGNGDVESPEQCDDGNTMNCDGCSAQCKTETSVCGNGTLDCHEDCDDGNTTSGDGCSATCKIEICGNSIVEGSEQCDDGNTTSGDGCSSTCQNEAHPPVAKCANRTVVANNTCTGGADVNDGSSDPDGNLVGCTQTPAGPYSGVGPHPVTLTCTDTTGLSASCTAVVTVVDETPPAIACPADLLVNTTTGSAVVNYPAPATGDNCGTLPVSCSIPSGALLPLGDHAVTCQVQDLGGNTNSCSFEIHVNAPPDAICTDVVVAADAACSGTGSISNNPFDPDGDTFACVQSPPGPYSLGDNTATLTCTDVHGTSDSCSATVSVVDTTPPAITCPDSTTVECKKKGSVVTYAASATDNCSVASTTCAPPSGSTFPVGSTTAVCTAADGSGNTSSCAFSVTVTDTQKPVVTTQSVTFWPPNHHYREFELEDCVTSIVDECEGSLTLEEAHAHITRITSDELEDDKLDKGNKGDGNTCNDIVLTGPMSADLRRERSGGSNGRLYTVYFELADGNGNVTASSCKVGVPHDQSPPNAVIDDGCKYCVGTGCGTCPGHDPVCTY